MKILILADEEAKYYYDYYQPGMLDDIDLILSCGDLHRNYLEFFSTMAKCPIVYVRGNHDSSFVENEPGGCICAEDTIVEIEGIRILGLGGSMKYREDPNVMFTDPQMMMRWFKLLPEIFRHKGFDILLTHAPARGLNDLDDLPHRGFETFIRMMDHYKPKYFIHGHVHMNYGRKVPRISRHGDTTVINGYEYYVLEY